MNMRLGRKQLVRNKQMSDDELQRTQVLNLADFKQVTKYEKAASKKPAIIVAILGIISITLGTTLPGIESYMSRKTVEDNFKVQQRKAEINLDGPEIEELVCTSKTLNKENGTDEVLRVTYSLEENKLKSLQKEYYLTQSENVTETPYELGSYLNALQSFLIQIDGYSVSVKNIDKGSLTTTKVDYEKLDITQVPDMHKSNYRFDILYDKDATKEAIIQDMTTRNYICE